MTPAEQMLSDATFDPAYAALFITAAVMSSLGLEQNNAVTLIGAMVISPLMLPVRALGFGLLRMDGAILRRASANLALSVIFGAIIGAGIAAASQRPEFGSEITSRESVTFLGLGVAVAGGALSALSRIWTDAKILDSLVGVGISVSLLPPLNVIGVLGLYGAWHDAAGAFAIFWVNLIGIGFACAIVFGIGGYVPLARWRSRLGLAIFMAAIATVSPAMWSAGYQARQISLVERYVKENFGAFLPSVQSVESVQIAWKDDPHRITVVVRSERAPTRDQVRRLNDAINASSGGRYRLTLVSDPVITVTP
jgi:uncharacterized hydrophobic protein (TIGR00271 family)